jgi:hypothetical protein
MAVSLANNTSNAKIMYENRVLYEEEFPKNSIQFHTGYENNLFGKVDTLGNSIRIQEGFLSFFATKDDKANASCIHFMADAFADCRNDYAFHVKKNNINLASPFFQEKLIVYDGWKKQETLYIENLNSTYFSFVRDLESGGTFQFGNFTNILKGVVKFESFVELLLIFIRLNELPLTRAGFFESKYNPIHTTGLVLEIYKDDAGSDEAREKFISDPNYGLVSELLAKRGLRFDAQVPWRIIANIQSNNLAKYVDPYLKTGYKIQDIFDNFYYKNFDKATNSTAFQEFKDYIKRFYNSYKLVFPKQNKFTETKCGIKNIFVYAEDIPFSEDSKEEDLFFLDIYYKSRLIEAKLNYKDSVQEFHRQNYRGLYLYEKDRTVGIQQAIEYINYNIGTLAFRSPSVKEINLTRAGNSSTM